jgi:FAD binding domain
VYEPESEEEVVRLMQKAIGEGWRLRVSGSGISPNALGFSSERMVCMGLMDKVLGIDVEKKQVFPPALRKSHLCFVQLLCACLSQRRHPQATCSASGSPRDKISQVPCAMWCLEARSGESTRCTQVRVQAGARVQDVVEALRPHGLTLQNFASVREQQIGGFTQVSAHGTGAAIPPVDEQVLHALLQLGSGACAAAITQHAQTCTSQQALNLASCGLRRQHLM